MKLEIVKSLLIGMCSVFGLNSCTAASNKIEQTENIESNMDVKSSQSALNEDSKKLVVFFSHTGENYNVGNIEKGNTHIIADMIADATGADFFEIVPEKDYPHDDYNECIEIAKKELQADARPEVKGDVSVVFLCNLTYFPREKKRKPDGKCRSCPLCGNHIDPAGMF